MKKFTLEVRLEYLNTSSTKVLLNLTIAIKDHFDPSGVPISWYYERDDEDMPDLDRDSKSIMNIPINFYGLVEE